MAGINAVRKLDNKEPIILRRDEAYIGVLIDDLTTKGTLEPYRLLTSRAEFRLLLRHDNAEERLIEVGKEVGLVTEDKYNAYLKKKEDIEKTKKLLETTTFIEDEPKVSEYLTSKGYDNFEHKGISGINLVKRPNLTTKELLKLADIEVDDEIAEKCDIDIKYEGYIEKAKREAKKLEDMEEIKLGVNFNYDEVDNLSLEGRQKLKEYKPETFGQASRISGVNPADLAVLSIAIKQGKGKSI